MFQLIFLLIVLLGAPPPPDIRLIYQDQAGDLILYDDGDERLLIDAEVTDEIRMLESPNDDYAAVFINQLTETTPGSFGGETDMIVAESGKTSRVFLISLETGEIVLERSLVPDDFVLPAGITMAEASSQWLREGINFRSWSPDGSRLVWSEATTGGIAGVEGEAGTPSWNGDGTLVVFNTDDQSVEVLSDTPGVAYDGHWSPDGQYLVYRGIRSFGTGGGVSAAGAFVMTLENGISAMTIPFDTGGKPADITIHKWSPDNRLLYSKPDMLTGSTGLFLYDPATDESIEILPVERDRIDSAGIDMDANGRILYTVAAVANLDAGAGVYLLDSVEDETPLFITDGEVYSARLNTGASFLGDVIVYRNSDDTLGDWYKIENGKAFGWGNPDIGFIDPVWYICPSEEECLPESLIFPVTHLTDYISITTQVVSETQTDLVKLTISQDRTDYEIEVLVENIHRLILVIE